MSPTEPLYWKARNLDVFNGVAWTTRATPRRRATARSRWRPTCRDDWRDRPAWTSDDRRSAIRRMRIRRRDRRGHDGRASGTRRARSSQAISPGTWDAPSRCAAATPTRARCTCRSRRSAQLAEATSGECQRQPGETQAHGAVQAGRGQQIRRSAARSSRAPSRPVTAAQVHFKAVGRRRQPTASTIRQRGRSEFDVDRRVEALAVRAHVGARRSSSSADAERPMDYIRAVDDYLHAARVPLRRAPAAAAGRTRRRWTTSSTRPTRATASTTRARWRCCCGWAASRRAWRPGSRPAATRRARRPGSSATPTRTRGSRCGSTSTAGSPSTRRRTRTPARSQVAALAPAAPAPRPPRPTPAPATPPPTPSGRTLAVRPELQLGTATARPRRGPRRATGFRGCWVWRRSSSALRAWCSRSLLFLRRPRGKTPMDRAIAEVEDALRRVGRPVIDRHDADPARAPARLALPGGRRLPARARRGPLRALAQPPPRDGPPRPAPRAGSGPRLRRRLRALWALPPRLERGERTPRSRTFEVETSVRVRG